jgi:hypothetical protein
MSTDDFAAPSPSAPLDAFASDTRSGFHPDGDGRDWGDDFEEEGERELTRSRESEWAAVRWVQKDEESTEYRHLASLPIAREVSGKTFEFTARDLELLIRANAFEPRREGGQIIFGLRGAVLAAGASASDKFKQIGRKMLLLQDVRPDHRQFRCVLGVYDLQTDKLSGFVASTVPCREAVVGYAKGGDGCNMLPSGCYAYVCGPHKKRNGCLREDENFNVLRSRRDTIFDLADNWDLTFPADNIHPAFANKSAQFSSWGCQTIRGNHSRQDGSFSGEFKEFREVLGLKPRAGSHGEKFSYVLLTGLEAAIASRLRMIGHDADEAEVTATLGRLRAGSRGVRVKALQAGLGIEVDGIFDGVVKKALVERQRKALGWADGVYGPEMDDLLKMAVFKPAPAPPMTEVPAPPSEKPQEQQQQPPPQSAPAPAPTPAPAVEPTPVAAAAPVITPLATSQPAPPAPAPVPPAAPMQALAGTSPAASGPAPTAPVAPSVPAPPAMAEGAGAQRPVPPPPVPPAVPHVQRAAIPRPTAPLAPSPPSAPLPVPAAPTATDTVRKRRLEEPPHGVPENMGGAPPASAQAQPVAAAPSSRFERALTGAAPPAPVPSADQASALRVYAGKLVERIPRTMLVGRRELIEVRLGTEDTSALTRGLAGSGTLHAHDLPVVETMAVDLVSSDGAFDIEACSEREQLVRKDALSGTPLAALSDGYGRWTWNVTPRSTGERKLLLRISARVLDSNGFPSPTTLPDREIAIDVKINRGQIARRGALWIVGILGAVLATYFKDTLYGVVKPLLDGLLGIVSR